VAASFDQLVCEFAPDIILATAKVVSTCLNENMYLIAGALIRCDCLLTTLLLPIPILQQFYHVSLLFYCAIVS
jgi:hypothetical protein